MHFHEMQPVAFSLSLSSKYFFSQTIQTSASSKCNKLRISSYSFVAVFNRGDIFPFKIKLL